MASHSWILERVECFLKQTVHRSKAATNSLSKQEETKDKVIFSHVLFLFVFGFYSQFGFHGHSRWKPETVYNCLEKLSVREQDCWSLGAGLQVWGLHRNSVFAQPQSQRTPGHPAATAKLDIMFDERKHLSGCDTNWNREETLASLMWFLGYQTLRHLSSTTECVFF